MKGQEIVFWVVLVLVSFSKCYRIVSYNDGYYGGSRGSSFLPKQKDITVTKYLSRMFLKLSDGETFVETTIEAMNVSPDEKDVNSIDFYSMKELHLRIESHDIERGYDHIYVDNDYPTYINVTERSFESEVELLELLGIIRRNYLSLYDQSDPAIFNLKGLHLAESRSDVQGVLYIDEDGGVAQGSFFRWVYEFETPLKFGEKRTLKFTNSYELRYFNPMGRTVFFGHHGINRDLVKLEGGDMNYMPVIPQSHLLFFPSSEEENSDVRFQLFIPESKVINATFEYLDEQYHTFSPNDEKSSYKYRFSKFLEIGPLNVTATDLAHYLMRLKINVNFTRFRPSNYLQYGEYDSLFGIGMNKRSESIKETCEKFVKNYNNSDIPKLVNFYNEDQIDELTDAILEDGFSSLFYEVDFKYCFEFVSKFCENSDNCDVDEEKEKEVVDFFMMVLNSYVVYTREVKLNLIGLEEIKTSILSMMKGIIFEEKLRIFSKKKLLLGEERNYHLIFQGNPGTGKTTCGRIMGKIFYALGIIHKERFAEVQRGDLVAGYVGQTALKTQEMINKNKGGVILVDEAYSLLYSESGKDFGAEALSVIMKEMNIAMDQDEKTLFIFAGYKDEMEEFLKKANMGFRRRIYKVFQFEDYSIDELTEIFMLKMNGTSFKLSEAANNPKKISNWFSESGELNDHEIRSMNNGGLVNRIIERIISVHVNSSPLNEKDLEKLLMIDEESIKTALRLYDYDRSSWEFGGFWNFTALL